MLESKPMLKAGSIEIRIVKDLRKFPDTGKRCLILLRDNWDDYSFKTSFAVHLYDDSSSHYEIGHLRIGKVNMKVGYVEIDVGSIEQLSEDYFSLGMSEDYYDNLRALPEATRKYIYTSLRDMAYMEHIWEKYKNESVTQNSLLRDISEKVVEEQYKRIAKGGARQTRYLFHYVMPRMIEALDPPILDFEVDPASLLPPTNIHAIIGRNGVGKSHCLKNMFHAVGNTNQEYDEKFGHFNYGEDTLLVSRETTSFVKVVAVSFSAFDDFGERPEDTPKIKFVRIGLDADHRSKDDVEKQNYLAEHFIDSAASCVAPAKLRLWHQALETLDSDPIFREYNLWDLAEMEDQDEFEKRCFSLFETLSSGHKIVLLTIASLVQHVVEKTLILIDEPETHLHPPLLGALIRALSDLLDQKNGVAIIATHSPVVLQEVPKKCSWKLSRTGGRLKAERPKIETFGENVSVLTDEVFRLELEESGFHRLLKQTANKYSTYDEAVASFGGQIGGEGRAILRGIYTK